MRSIFIAGAVVAVALAASGCTKEAEEKGPDAAVSKSEGDAVAPAGAKPGACYAKDRTPARVETVTEQVLVTAAVRDADGKVTTPASYRSETKQKMIGGSEILQFQTPCQEEMTPEFVQSLQRALTARGLYSGRIDGKMGSGLRQAIRKYQQDTFKLDSALLSLRAAQSLGLVAYDLKDL